MSPSQPQGYLAVPPSGAGRGVLVLHAWWGLNDTMKAFCNRLAEAGFTAFAADLYHGQIATTIPEAEKLRDAMDIKQARADIAEAVSFLRQRAAQADQGLAVIGFSLGAYFALALSAAQPKLIRSAVVFYGTGPVDFSTSQAAYLGHFAEKDVFESNEDVDTLEHSLRAAGRPVTFHRYLGTGHWFFEPDRTDAYNAAAASLAWERTLAFLKETLPLNAK
jgi:carboxymethylenebutenolidase